MLPAHRYQRSRFVGQHADEVILKVIHRHWFTILLQYLGIFLVTLLLIGGTTFLQTWLDGNQTALSYQGFLFLQNTVVLFIWFYAFILWIDYYFDVWIVTNQRIVNIEQKGLFVREISELQLNRVQDVTSEVMGLIPTLLDFGDVFVQTAGETERFIFRQVPCPNTIKDAIMQLSHSAPTGTSNTLTEVFGPASQQQPKN